MSDIPVSNVYDKVISITEQLKQMQTELAQIAIEHANLKRQVAFERPMIDALKAQKLYEPALYEGQFRTHQKLQIVERYPA